MKPYQEKIACQHGPLDNARAAYETPCVCCLVEKLAALEAERDEAIIKFHNEIREGRKRCDDIVKIIEAERDALAALVDQLQHVIRKFCYCRAYYLKCVHDEKFICAAGEACGLKPFKHHEDCEFGKLKSHPSVERARLVAEVVGAAKEFVDWDTYVNDGDDPDHLQDKYMGDLHSAINRLAAHDSKNKSYLEVVGSPPKLDDNDVTHDEKEKK